ncbi:hypothetical protein WA158_007143 [Blastocystis sp. Blastoise]
MSANELCCIDDKYLFTFQDETQLWISKDFIEKYQQFPFHDIIKHTDKYDDGSYYIDMPSSPINKVFSFLMKDNMDISSLNLRDSYDIYKTLIEYSVVLDKEIQSDLLLHIKELFYKYLKDNNYYMFFFDTVESCMPMELFNLDGKKIRSNGLFTSKRKDELLYYSLLIKMMNINTVEIRYDYASNIPLEYICPSCIQDIFPSLKNVKITVTTHYKHTELLLNPNSDEYIMEYIRLFSELDYEIENPEEYEYYTESEMNEYNKISSLDLNKYFYSHKLINSYNGKREKNELPKLYRYVVNEAIYTNDYSKVETNKTEDEYISKDIVKIEYDDKTNDKTFSIDKVSSEYGISQLLLLPSYMCISKIIFDKYWDFHCNVMFFMKLFEEGVFDSLTTLSLNWIKELTNTIDKNLFNKIMTTHLFPNVTEFIYDDESFQLSLIKKKYFPKLHIINYDNIITTDNFDSLFPASLISMIDTIRINNIDNDKEEEIALRLDEIVYTHSIHIDKDVDFICYLPRLNELLAKNLISIDYLSIYSSRSENINVFEYIENNNLNIDSLDIAFNDDDQHKIDVRNSLERFLNSDILKHLNNLYVSFNYGLSIEYLTWISTLFNDNKFNNILKLEVDLHIKEDSSSEYLIAYENILEKLFSKASIVTIKDWALSFINRLIPKGCFHNTTQLNLDIDDMPDYDFCELYTTNNFPQLKSIKIYNYYDREWRSSFIKTFCNYINNNNFPSSTIVRLGKSKYDYAYYIYDPNASIFRCQHDNNSFMNTIIGNKDEMMSKFEIETLLDYINENKTQNLRFLRIYIYDDEQLSKLTKCITTGKFPKLKEFLFVMYYDISDKTINIYKQQLKDSTFIQENHVDYKFDTFY